MKPIELPPHAQLMQFILGKWISKPIYVAAELGIADMLTDGPKSVDDLARMSETHAPSLYRLMRALAAVGIFSETNDNCFELTPMAECLKTGVMRPVALMEVFVMGGGRERTEAEFRNLLEFCGFQLSQIVPTDESIFVIEAVRV
jgi:hypothetical protein